MTSLFSGIVNFDKKLINQTLLEKLNDQIVDWQPDISHQWLQEGMAISQLTRFNTAESQYLILPLKNHLDQFFLCGNVRLDNRDALCKIFNWQNEPTMPDEQLILKAYEVWGEDCPYYLEGDFSFVIWNKKLNKLFAARDIIGYKTFYYHFIPHKHFIFASTPKALLNHPDISVKLDEYAFAYYLIYTSPHLMQTCYESIKKLPPAHYLVIENNQIKIQRYWNLENVKKIRYQKREDYYDHFRELFERAVAARLRSHYPIASQISGGLDSSSVTAVAAALLQKDNQSLFAFGLVPPNDLKLLVRKKWSANDYHLMAQVASYYPNIELINVTAEERSVIENLDHFQQHLDTPLRNVYNRLWYEEICHLAQQKKSRVLLIGQLGNFTISWKGLPPQSFNTRLRGIIRWLRKKHQTIKQKLMPQLLWEEYSPIAKSFANKYLFYEQYLKDSPFPPIHSVADALSTITDIGNFFVAIEALYGIECRDPTADRQIIEFCQAIPPDVFNNGQKNRLLIREGMEKYLPHNLRWCEKRGTQAADWYIKFNNELPLFEEFIESLCLSEFASFFDVTTLNTLLKNWRVPDLTKETHMSNKFITNYQAKFLRGFIAFAFLNQIKQHKKI